MTEREGSGVQQREGVNGVCTSIYQQPERSIPKHLPASDASQDAAPPPPAVAALPPLLAPFAPPAPLLSPAYLFSCYCLPDLDLSLCLAANERENNARNVEQQQQEQGSSRNRAWLQVHGQRVVVVAHVDCGGD